MFWSTLLVQKQIWRQTLLCDLILDRTFDRIVFNRIDDEVFRKLVKARLAYPTSKAATVVYLKNHFDEDVDLSKIYRYLDKLSDHQHDRK